MHVALGYRWFPTAAGYHLERALRSLGHTVTYVGLPYAGRPGYDGTVSIGELFATLPEKPDLYLWIDPAGRYFPPGIENLPIPTACYLIDVHLGHWRLQAARFLTPSLLHRKTIWTNSVVPWATTRSTGCPWALLLMSTMTIISLVSTTSASWVISLWPIGKLRVLVGSS